MAAHVGAGADAGSKGQGTLGDAFARNFAKSVPFLHARTRVADLETPVSAYLKLSQSRPHGHHFLLESVEGGATRGRYSIIGLDPDILWRCVDGKAFLNTNARHEADAFVPCTKPPLDSLRALLAASRMEPQDDLPLELLPPMAAGVFGYLGYDMVRQMERLGPAKPDPIGVPDAVLIRPTIMVIFDALRDEMHFITPVRPHAGESAPIAFERAEERLTGAIRALDGSVPRKGAVPDGAALPAIVPCSNTTPQDYSQKVLSAKEFIAAGDIFQIVLSQRFCAPFTLPAFALYRALRRVNPAPFLCYLDFGAFQIVCSSPEILVRVRGGTITIRPLAGTRPRGATPAQDLALEQELLADPKERAEHVMLLDLGRNDVGRVATLGSVTVPEQFCIERYSHVMHIVSHVEGALSPEHDALSALVAGFPAGTVSGAPKIRAMEIIDALEEDKRGIYAGCIGYFSAYGDMDTCIVLRTAVVKDGMMHVQAGAGIVADSNPASEQAECVNKARALFRAGEEAVRFASEAGYGQ